ASRHRRASPQSMSTRSRSSWVRSASPNPRSRKANRLRLPNPWSKPSTGDANAMANKQSRRKLERERERRVRRLAEQERKRHKHVAASVHMVQGGLKPQANQGVQLAILARFTRSRTVSSTPETERGRGRYLQANFFGKLGSFWISWGGRALETRVF